MRCWIRIRFAYLPNICTKDTHISDDTKSLSSRLSHDGSERLAPVTWRQPAPGACHMTVASVWCLSHDGSENLHPSPDCSESQAPLTWLQREPCAPHLIAARARRPSPHCSESLAPLTWLQRDPGAPHLIAARAWRSDRPLLSIRNAASNDGARDTPHSQCTSTFPGGGGGDETSAQGLWSKILSKLSVIQEKKTMIFICKIFYALATIWIWLLFLIYWNVPVFITHCEKSCDIWRKLWWKSRKFVLKLLQFLRSFNFPIYII